MNPKTKADWDPYDESIQRDQIKAYDEMRERCPVAYSEAQGWTLFKHEDVLRALTDEKTFSNIVSSHISVPNGMDPPQHTEYRRIVERYFSAEGVNLFEPTCREITGALIERVLASGRCEVMSEIAVPFAVHVQCAFLGWPLATRQTLADWTRRNYQATLAQDRPALAQIALEFQRSIDNLIEKRRNAGATASDDITASLMHDKVHGRPLSNKEIAGILRNWTVGETGTISAAIGILVHYLADHAKLQDQFRSKPALLPSAIEEILRIHGPLVTNRRITACPVEISGRKIAAGERITLNWISANRDPRAFEHPDAFCLDRDPTKNLLWGAGIHICPGAPLARMEMRVVIEELLKRTTGVALAPGKTPVKAVYPASGFASVEVELRIH